MKDTLNNFTTVDNLEQLKQELRELQNLKDTLQQRTKSIYLPEGTKIMFQRGHMIEPAPATVISTGVHNSYIWIYIENEISGKQRQISLTDVTEIIRKP